MAKIILTTVKNGNTLSAINNNFQVLAAELQNRVLYRDNPDGEPNAIADDIDLNGNDLFNVGNVSADSILVDGQTIQELVDVAVGGTVVDTEAARDAAIAAAAAASVSQASAASSAVDAQTAEDGAEAQVVLATAQVGLAANQVALATTQANNAQASAVAAAASAASIAGGPVTDVAGLTGSVGATSLKTALSLSKADIGLTNVYNTPVIMSQGELVKSGANIVLQRYEGSWLFINNDNYQIPSAGVTLAPTGLTPSTLYYIYAYMNAGVMTLEASTTVPVIDTSTAVMIKTGDVTRRLVGKVFVITGPAFSDTATSRLVVTWLNRRQRIAEASQATDLTSTNTGAEAELTASTRLSILTWANEVTRVETTGMNTNNTAGTINRSFLKVDATVIRTQLGTFHATGAFIPVGMSAPKVLTEGVHTVNLFTSVTAGTGTWYAGLGVSAVFIG